MTDSTIIERAYERIDELEAAIGRLHDYSIGVDGDADSQKRRPKPWTNAIPISVGAAAEVAIAAVLDVLASASGGVHTRVARNPPSWWRDLIVALRKDRHENPEAGRLLDAVAILDPYVCEDTPLYIVGLVFIATDIDRKLRFELRSQGFRGEREPHPQKTVVLFDPEIDADVRDALHKSRGEILPFPERCDSFLRRALNEIADILE